MANEIFTVVIAVVLAVSVGLIAWTAAKVVALGEKVSEHGNQIVDLASRIGKLETAALLAATIPGKLDVLNERIADVQKSLERVEKELKGGGARKP